MLTKKLSSNFFLIFSLYFSLYQAYAFEERFRQSSIEVVNRLIEKGYKKVHDLDLVALSKRHQSLHFQLRTHLSPQFETYRDKSAYYYQGVIYFDHHYAHYSDDQLQLLGTHELLGSLNFQGERKYIKSSLLKILADATKKEAQQLIQNPIYRWNFRDGGIYNYSGEGGVTGVGGGGDIVLGWVHYLVFKALINQNDNDPYSFLFYRNLIIKNEKAAGCNIELNEVNNRTQVVFSLNNKVSIDETPYLELLVNTYTEYAKMLWSSYNTQTKDFTTITTQLHEYLKRYEYLCSIKKIQ